MRTDGLTQSHRVNSKPVRYQPSETNHFLNGAPHGSCLTSILGAQ